MREKDLFYVLITLLPAREEAKSVNLGLLATVLEVAEEYWRRWFDFQKALKPPYASSLMALSGPNTRKRFLF